MTAAVLSLALFAFGATQQVVPKDDMVITKSCRIKPGHYRIPDRGKPGILRIVGKNVAVDMSGVTIDGAAKGDSPDSYHGTGILVSGKGQIVFGGSIRGYKEGLRVAGGSGDWLIDMDVSDNYASRLASTTGTPSPADRLDVGSGAKGGWAAYGAGIYIDHASAVRIIRCTGSGGQNGLVLDGAKGCLVRACNFGFHSGWGIALWASSNNRFVGNRVDWCVRGYSAGLYARPQNSAGVLLVSGSTGNRFDGNSITHCGVGVLLAPRTGNGEAGSEPGCDGNEFMGNDFSSAVICGVSAAGSSGNHYENNRVQDSPEGMVFDSCKKGTISANYLRSCDVVGVDLRKVEAFEVSGNYVEECPTGIRLTGADSKGVAPKISGNRIVGGKVGILVGDSNGVQVVGNSVTGASNAFVTSGTCPGIVHQPAAKPMALKKVEHWKTFVNFMPGRRYVIMQRFGPYEFLAPKALLQGLPGGAVARYEVLGAHGKLDVVRSTGDVDVAVHRKPDRPPEVEITPHNSGSPVRYSVVLNTKPKNLVISGALLPASWSVRYWNGGPSTAREARATLDKLESAPPTTTVEVDGIGFDWGKESSSAEKLSGRFLMSAGATVELPAGTYELLLVSSCPTEVLVDGKRTIDAWSAHAARGDAAVVKLSGGSHRIVVRSFVLHGHGVVQFGVAPK